MSARVQRAFGSVTATPRTLAGMGSVLALALALRTTAADALGSLHRRRRPSRARAVWRADGTQEARVVVDHGYHPSCIELERGVPAVLRFERAEDDPCSELLVSELLPSSYRLPAREETVVRFTPETVGTFAFTCGLGMYTGLLIVRPGREVR